MMSLAWGAPQTAPEGSRPFVASQPQQGGPSYAGADPRGGTFAPAPSFLVPSIFASPSPTVAPREIPINMGCGSGPLRRRPVPGTNCAGSLEH